MTTRVALTVKGYDYEIYEPRPGHQVITKKVNIRGNIVWRHVNEFTKLNNMSPEWYRVYRAWKQMEAK